MFCLAFCSTARPAYTQEPTPQLGPFKLQDASNNTLRASFLLHGLSSIAVNDVGDVDDTLFTFRRLRPGFDLMLWEQRFVARAVWDLAPGSAQLVDGFASYELTSSLTMTAGQFKTPLYRYRLNSGSDQVLVDWSRTTKYTGGERQRGASLRGGLLAGFSYNVGVFTGRNSRRSHGTGVALIYDSVLSNPSSLTSSGNDASLQPEVIGHVGWSSSDMDASTFEDREGGGPGVYVGVGGAHDFAPELAMEAKTRLSLEVMAKWRGMSLYTGGFVASSELVQQPDATTFGVRAGLVEATYRVGQRWSLGGRFSLIVLNDVLVEDARMTREMMEPSSKPLYSRFEEYGLGAKYDLYGENFQLALDVGYLRDHVSSGGVNASGFARAQWLLRF